MANERLPQSKKSYRQIDRAAKAAQAIQSRTSAIPDGVAATMTVSQWPSMEIVLPRSMPVRDEPASKAIEAVETLVATLCEEDSSADDIKTLRAGNHQESEGDWSRAVDAKLNDLMERSKTFERERIEIESLREHLKQAIDTAEFRLNSSSEDAGTMRHEELETQLIKAQQETTKVSTMLLHARAEYQSLLAFIESEAVKSGHSDAELKTIAQKVLEKTDARETELSLEVSQLNDQLQFLQSELDDAKAVPGNNSLNESELRIQVEQLRSQLLEARHEAVELRMQSNDLSARLAKFQGPVLGQKSETLSWEQRKQALLQQLEAETHAETPCDPRKVLEIERILEQTHGEIERRDQEISDLKALIEHQSIAQDGMSIGVAAVAQMIESDSLIVAERLRLKELRADWEQKQRQAEIEMSMERAKLARERLEIQEKTQRYEDNNPPQTEAEAQTGKTRTRGNWLARLGLRDE